MASTDLIAAILIMVGGFVGGLADSRMGFLLIGVAGLLMLVGARL